MVEFMGCKARVIRMMEVKKAQLIIAEFHPSSRIKNSVFLIFKYFLLSPFHRSILSPTLHFLRFHAGDEFVKGR